jgi:hypothetical protein
MVVFFLFVSVTEQVLTFIGALTVHVVSLVAVPTVRGIFLVGTR